MNEYNPDRWVILKLTNNQKIFYKVLGVWFGGYLQGDSWRVNSGITKVELDGDVYKFYGRSGSVYICNKNNYGMTVLMASIIPESDKVTVLKQEDFTKLEL